jgi:hypothetical protein
MATIKISQLGNISSVTSITDDTLIPLVGNVLGTLTTLRSNVGEVSTYMLGTIPTDVANNAANVLILQANVSSLSNTTANNSSNIGLLQNGVSSIASNVGILQANVETIFGNINAVESNVAILQDEIQGVESNVAILQDEMVEVNANVSAIESNVTILQSNIDVLGNTIAGIEGSLSGFESNIGLLKLEDEYLNAAIVNIITGVTTFSNLSPNTSNEFDLGSDTERWRDLYLSGATIYLGNTIITSDDNSLSFSLANVEPEGDRLIWQVSNDGGLVFPDGSIQFTANAGEGGSSYGNLNVAEYLPTYSGNVGGIFVGNVQTDNYFYANGTPISFGGGSDLSGTVYGTDNLANVTTGYDNVVLGNLNLPTLTEGYLNTVIGINNADGLVDGGQNVFVGYNNFVSNHATLAQTVVIGTNNTCNADQSVFIGSSIYVEDPTYIYSVGIGNSVDIYGRQAVAIGDQAAAAEYGTAVGTFSYAGTYLSTALGKDTYVLSGSEGSMAVGLNSGVWNNCLSSMAIGESATVYDDSNSTIVIGAVAYSDKNNSIAIGAGAHADTNGNLAIAIGKDSAGTGHSAIAIGTEATGSAANCIAIGNGATCSGNDESIAIGTGVDTDFSYQFKLGTPDHTVTIPGGFMVYSLEDPSSGTPTINQTAGRVTISSGQTSKVVNNNLVTLESHVFAVVSENDSTAYVKNVVPGNGSFTINLGAAATSNTKVSFFVVQAFDVAI